METQEKLIVGKQFVRFAISGVTAMVVGMVVLFVLTDVFHIWYLASSATAFVATFIVAFSLQKFWSFQNKALAPIHKQVSLSLIVTVGNFFLNAGSMYVLVDRLHIHYFISQIFTYGLFGLLDFLIYKFVIFKND